MACEYCHGEGYHFTQCPNFVPPKSSRYCSICNYGILDGEEYIFKNPALNIAPIKYERKHKKPMSQLDLEKLDLLVRLIVKRRLSKVERLAIPLALTDE